MTAARRTKGAIRGAVAQAGVAAVGEAIEKYMAILGVSHYPRPGIQIVDNVGHRWLGLYVYYASDKPSVIKIQRSILKNQRTLERIVAHEVVHHKNHVETTSEARVREFALMHLRLGRNDLHGQAFLRDAEVINQAVGDECFVTVTSDAVDTLDACLKPYTLLIVVYGSGASAHLGYSIAVRPSKAQLDTIQGHLQRNDGARVAMTTEPWWAIRAPRIGDGRFSIPRAPYDEKLRALYDAAPQQAAEATARPLAFGELPPSPAARQRRAEMDARAYSRWILAREAREALEQKRQSQERVQRNREAFERDLAARKQAGGARGTTRSVNIYPVRARERAIAVRIVKALDLSDLQPQYRKLHERVRSCDPMTGHCHTATNAFFHATGGFDGPYLPYFIEHEGASHWYLLNMDTGSVVDLTASQFRTQPPYELGRRGPAMRGSKPDTEPTHRAARLLARAGFVATR